MTSIPSSFHPQDGTAPYCASHAINFSIQGQFEAALMKGEFAEAENLLAKGAKINDDVISPLVSIASLIADSAARIRAFEFLLSKGAYLNSTDGYGRTALHWSARIGDSKAFLWLLERWPDSTIKDHWGYTALHEAMENPYLGVEAIRGWVRAGGSLDEVTPKNETALNLCCFKHKYEKARALFDHGAAIGIVNESGYSEFAYAIRGGIPDEYPNPLGPLHVLEFNQLALEMAERMKDLSSPVARGQTPLLCLASNKRVNGPDHAINLDKHFTELLRRGASIYDIDEGGNTIFHIAAMRGDDQLLRFLSRSNDVPAFIDWGQRNLEGKTAAEIADERGHQNVSNLLAEYSVVHSNR